MSKGSKVIKSGTMTPVRGGPSGKVGKQGGTATSVGGKVSIPGNSGGGGKFAKGGPSGKVGNQKGVKASPAGKVATTR